MFAFRQFVGLCVAAITTAVPSNPQEPPPDPAFEVASVKLLQQRQPGPSRIDRGRVILPFTTLKALIVRAYSVKIYQVEGPDWLDAARYEVLAKIPEGADPGQVP